VVRARVGESLIIGGLISDKLSSQKAGIPLLSQIPFIGWLFGAHERDAVRSELVLTITPRAVEP
jgi:general secretion pathway protein D